MGERDIFCSSCGTRQAPENFSSAPPPQPPPPYPNAAPNSGVPPGAPPQAPHRAHDPLAGLSPRAASILCYVPTVGWIASVIFLSATRFRNDQIVRFHAFQGLYLFAIWLLIQWFVHPLLQAAGDHVFRVDRLLSAIVMAVSVFMMIKASHDEAYVLPIVGELAQRSAQER